MWTHRGQQAQQAEHAAMLIGIDHIDGAERVEIVDFLPVLDDDTPMSTEPAAGQSTQNVE